MQYQTDSWWVFASSFRQRRLYDDSGLIVSVTSIARAAVREVFMAGWSPSDFPARTINATA